MDVFDVSKLGPLPISNSALGLGNNNLTMCFILSGIFDGSHRRSQMVT